MLIFAVNSFFKVESATIVSRPGGGA